MLQNNKPVRRTRNISQDCRIIPQLVCTTLKRKYWKCVCNHWVLVLDQLGDLNWANLESKKNCETTKEENCQSTKRREYSRQKSSNRASNCKHEQTKRLICHRHRSSIVFSVSLSKADSNCYRCQSNKTKLKTFGNYLLSSTVVWKLMQDGGHLPIHSSYVSQIGCSSSSLQLSQLSR